ncbi:MAG: decaprenylphospho-beta-D-ribofuranose 2-oxidase, partial [Alphaproteobacteria bacterium]
MIRSWGNVEIDSAAKIIDASSNAQALVIGNCRSYGDVCISSNHDYINNTKQRRIINFDKDNATITVESGITLKVILNYILSYNMVLKVTPGTSYATVGGCIANDVHGKNHETEGSFAASVIKFSLKLPTGDIIECSRKNSSHIFWATLGGLGLTGNILQVTLQLKNVENTALIVSRSRHNTLTSLMESMDRFKNAPYCVAWLDTAQSGQNMGRGILELAYHAHDSILVKHQVSKRNISHYAPSCLLNKNVVKVFNYFYFKRAKANKQNFESYEQFQYPLDHVQNWNKLYGRQGFYQFQCVLPFDHAESMIRSMLSLAQKSGFVSPLAVLKRLGAQSQGYLSFPMAGYTLALDIPAREGAIDLIRQFELLTLDGNGRIYPA